MRLSIGVDNRDQILKDIDSLSLEKYIDEIANAALEGIARCKTEKDAWAAAEVSTIICRRVARSPVYQPHDNGRRRSSVLCTGASQTRLRRPW